jgi:DNA-binding LacI/PurR family transcriptional regulator
VRYPVTAARLAGFRDAFEKAGRPWSETPVAVAARNTREDGRDAVALALAQLRPTTVIAMSDQLAAGARDVLGPSVAISGWDDSDLAAELGFTSIRQSLFDQGVACASIATGRTTATPPPSWSIVRR